MQTMSKAEIAAMAQQEAIKRLVQATIKEQEVEMNSSQAIKHWDRQSEMIIAKKEQAEDDIEAAKKARKKALEDEERSAEEQTKAAKGAAARAAFEAMNKGSLSNENDEDLIAGALNPALGKQKQSQIKLLRTKGKELIQAARMKKLQKAFKVALKKAKKNPALKKEVEQLKKAGKFQEATAKEQEAEYQLKKAKTAKAAVLNDLNAEVKKTEKIAEKANVQQEEEARNTAKANEKQAAVKQDTKRLIEQAKEGDVSSREDDQQGKLEEAVTKAEKLQAALPMLEQLSAEQKTIREELGTRMKKTIALLHEELHRANSSPSNVNKLSEDVEKMQETYEKELQKETVAQIKKNQAKRAEENVRDTRVEVNNKMAELNKERNEIYKLRRRLLWSRIASKVLSPSSDMRFSDVRNTPRRAATMDDGVAVLKSFDFVTGELLTEYFDDNSPQGRNLDKDMFYRLKGGMVIDYRFNYDAPETTRAYAGSSSRANVGAKGGSVIIVEGRNFGCRDYSIEEKRDGRDNFTWWESIEDVQKLTAWVFETDSTGKGWNKCIKTNYLSDGRLECIAPPGTGVAREMKVTLGGQGSKPKVLLNYNRPVVSKVVNPARSNIDTSNSTGRCRECGAPSGEYWITIEGWNFGPTRSTWGLIKADEAKHGIYDRPKMQNEHFSQTPAIKIGDAYCLQTRWVSDTEARCLVPPGLGKNHIVSLGPVNGLYSDSKADNVRWEYERPVVSTILPRNGPTYGNQSTKIYGENFGKCFTYISYTTTKGVKGPSARFCPTVYPSIDCEPCKSFTRVNSRLIECVADTGAGTNKFVNVKLGDYDVARRNSLYDYNGPMVTKVRPLHGPTTGGNTLDITGVNFGLNIEAIMTRGCNKGSRPTMTVGRIACADLKIISNTKATCTLSTNPGIGKNLPIGMSVGGLSARLNYNPDAVYTFDTPEISKITMLKTSAPNDKHLNAFNPHGRTWANTCPQKNGGCSNPDNWWQQYDYSFKIYGKNFGTRIYSNQFFHPTGYYSNYRGRHMCGFGNFQGSATYISDTEILCRIPQNQHERLARGSNGLQPQRVYVTVAGQSSYRLGMESSKSKFYELDFFEYKNANLQGNPIKAKETKTLKECKKSCANLASCAAFTVKSGSCTYYSANSATSCGKSKESGVVTYIKEGVTDTGNCVDTRSLVMGPYITSTSPYQRTEGKFAGSIRISGKNFGLNADSTRAKSIKAYYNNEECLETEYVSDSEVKCKPRSYPSSAGGVALGEDFEGAWDTNKWKSTNGKAILGGSCAYGSPFGKAMVFKKDGEIISNPVNVLRGGKVSFSIKLCGFGYMPTYESKGVTLSASRDGGSTWFVVAGFNTFHRYRHWRKVTIDLYNDNTNGAHPAASGSTMFKLSGPKEFAIDEFKIESKSVKWPVRVSVNVNSPTPEKNITMSTLDMGLNLATGWSVPPQFRTISRACTTGQYCQMPSKTDSRGFPGFSWTKNRYEDLYLSGSLQSCKSEGTSETECMKLLKHDGKKSTYKDTNFKPSSEVATVNLKFSFPVLVYQLRLVHAEESKAECRPKTFLINYPGGNRTVNVEDIDKKTNVGNGYFKDYDIVPFAAEDIRIFTTATQKNCKKATLSIGQLSLRGDLLSNVNRRSSWGKYAWASCNNGLIGKYNLGRYYQNFWSKSEYKFNCEKLHNGIYDKSRMTVDGQAWATPYPNKERDNWSSRPRGRPPHPEVTINFNRVQDIWAINIAQKHRYHAKSVTVKYFDEKKKQRGKAEKYNLEDKDFDMQKFQLSQARKKVKSVAIYIDDVYENPIRKKFPFLYDTFKKFDKKAWIFPDKKAITYDYGLENQAGHAKGIYFSGDAENQLAIHSAQAWPATGTTITGAVVGAPGKCNDHFIMISTKPQRKWSFGHSPDVLKFAYNCDELAIYQMEEPSRGKRQPRVIPCRATGKKHRFQIKLEQDGVGFVSDACANAENSAIPNNSGYAKVYDSYNPFATKPGQPAQDIYVYFGASQDRKQETKKPYFEMMKIVSAGYGLGEVELIGEDAVSAL
jgi:hypothetical protein